MASPTATHIQMPHGGTASYRSASSSEQLKARTATDFAVCIFSCPNEKIVYKRSAVSFFTRAESRLNQTPANERICHAQTHAHAGHNVQDMMATEHDARQADRDGPQPYSPHVRLGVVVDIHREKGGKLKPRKGGT
jgi:hypothetical protein